MPKQLNVNLSFTADIGKARAELQSLQKSLQQLSITSIKSENLGITKEIQSAIKDVNELQVKLQSATSSTGGLDLGKFSSSLSKGNKTLNDYANSLSALGPQGKAAFAQLTQSIVTAEVPLKKSSFLLSEFATTLKNTARWQLSSTILHGFMGAVQGAVSYAQDLNESLNSIRIVTGQTTEQMAEFAERANKAAQALSTTTTAYTDAALIFYQQGLGDEEVTERTNAVIKMANVTGDSVEEVSSYMTAIWNNFDDGSEALEHYADIITALGAATASSSAEISAGLEKFVSIGKTIGLSYDYATSALATIVANTRQSADQVGTGLRTIFSRLQGLSLGETLEDGVDLNKYSKALQTIGVNILDATGNMKDMDTILDSLAEKWDTLSQAQQTALAQTVGGVRQYTTLISLMNNWDDMKTNLNTAQNSDGTLQRQADIYAESWEAAQKRVKAAWQAIYDDLLDDKFFIIVLNGFEKLLQGVDGLIDAFGGLSSIVPFLGTILLKAFGDDLAGSIDRIFYNIYQGSELGKQKILELRHAAVKTMADIMQNDGTAVGAAQSAVYAGMNYNPADENSKLGGQAGLQEALLQKTQALQSAHKELTEEEEKQVQLLLDQNRILGDEYVNITKNVEAQKQEAEQQAKDLLMQYKAKKMPQGQSKDEEGFAKAIQSVKALQKEYTALSGFTERYKKSVADLGTSGASGFEKTKDAMVSYLRSIQDIDPEIQGLEDAIKRLADAATPDELKKQFEELGKHIEDTGVKAYEAANDLRELGNGAGISGIDGKVDALLNNFGTLGTLTDKQIQTFANFGMQVDQATGFITNLDGSVVSLSQGFVSGAQAGMSYAMALSTAKNFGDQLFDQDVSVIQKIVSLFMALTSAISAVNKVSETCAVITAAVKNAKEQETFATMKQIAAEKTRNFFAKLIPGLKTAEAAATTAVTAATNAETAAVEANTIAWYSNPILAIIAVALLAVVAVISAVSSAMKKNSEEIAENAEKSRDAAAATKEVVDANQDAIDSYQEAYQAYLKDKTAKDDLIEVSRNVCEQLEIEGAALARARGDYDALTQAIYDYQDAEIQTALQKNNRAQNDTAQEFMDNMRDGTGRFSGDRYLATIGGRGKDEKLTSDAITNLGDELTRVSYKGTVKINAGQSTDEMRAAYEEVLAVVEEVERLAGNSTELLNNSETYQNMLDWLEKSRDSYEALLALEDEEAQLRTMQIVNSAMAENQSITTMEEYETLRQQVIDSLKEEIGLDDEQAEAVANTYLKQSAAVQELAEAYSVLEDAADVSGIDTTALTNFYNTLDDSEKEIFASLNFETADSVEGLEAQLDLLQARADKNAIQVQLEAVQDAQDKFKEGMSAPELQQFQVSSGIDWGNEEQDIIEYSNFLSMSYAQQSAYLEQLETQLSQNLIKATAAVIVEDQAMIEAYNADLTTAQNNLIAVLESEEAQAAKTVLKTARATLEEIQATEKATEAEIIAAQQAVTEAQQVWEDLTGPAQREVNELESAIASLNTEIANSEEELRIQVMLEDSALGSQMASAESLEQLRDLAGRYGDALTTASNGTAVGDSSYDEYANGLLNIAEKYDSCSEAAEQYQNALNALSNATDENKEALQEQVRVAQEHLEVMVGCEEAAKKYGLEADTLASQMKEIANAEGLSEKQALAMAIANERMNRGVATLVNNWKDWKKILQTTENTAEDYAATLADVSDAVQDLVGWYDDLNLDSKFVEQNMQLIDKAAEGDVTAILELGAAVASYTVGQAELNTTLAEGLMADGSLNALQEYANLLGEGITASEAFASAQAGVQAGFDAIANNLEALQNNTMTLTECLGGEQGLQDWVNQLNAYAAATGMTANEMQQMLQSVGVTANVLSDYQEQEVTVPTYTDQITNLRYEKFPVTKFDPVTGTSFSAYDSVPIYTRGSVPGPPLTTTGFVEVASIQMEGIDGTGAKVQPPKFSGKKAPSSTAKSGGTGNKPSKTGGSGGSGSDKPKEHNSGETKIGKDEKERYHVIKNQIEDLTSLYDKISKAKDRAFGSARVANLNKEINAQKKLNDANRKYLEEIESYLGVDKALMAGYGAQFDSNGTITNYDALIQNAVNEYNAAVEAFNQAYTDDDGAKEAMEAAEKRYEQFIKDLEQYEETQDLYKDQLQQIIDDANALHDLMLEKTQLEVQLKIDVDEEELEYLNSMFDNIENKAYDVAEAFGYLNGMTANYLEEMKAYGEGLTSILENNGFSKSDIENMTKFTPEELLQGSSISFNRIIDALSDGEGAGFTADDVDTIKEYVSSLISANEELREVRQTVHEQLVTVWEEWNEKIDDGISKIEHLQAVTESYKNIIDIVGQKNLGLTNSFMAKMQQQAVDQANDKLVAEKARYDALAKSRDDAYAKFAEQKEKGILSPEEIKAWEDSLRQMDEDVQSASEDFQSAWEEALEAANTAFEESVDRIIDSYSDAAAGLLGSISELQEAFNRGKELNDQYLDDYEKIYQFNKLNRDITKSVDETENVKAKKELLELQSKINAIEESGVEISEYTINQLRLEYELKKAQIELEEAHDAKSQVQMQRDADGNYSYVYTANDQDVAKAEQNYADKLHDMQVANADYIDQLQENMVQMEVDYQDQVKEIMLDTSLSAEERMVKINELNEFYDEKMKFYISEAGLWEENSQRLYEQDWANYAAATGYKISEEDKWLDHWDETQLALLTGFDTLEEYQSNHNMNVANLLLDSGLAFSTWEANIEEAMNNAGTSIGTFEDDATESLQNIASESETTKDAIVDMGDEMVTAVDNVVDAIVNWENQYSQTVQKMLTENSALITSFNAVIRAWSNYSSSMATGDDGTENYTFGDNSNSGSGSGSGGSSSGSSSGSGSGGTVNNSDKIAGVAAAIWMDGSAASGWGNNTTRAQKFEEKGVTAAQAYINAHGTNGDIYSEWASKRSQLRNYYYGAFDTGGYTGEWGADGRMAILHQKEIVLNEDDTTKFLQAVDIVRQISEMIDLNALSSAGGFTSLLAAKASSSAQELQQEVTIHAEFPNATDRDEISAAFSDLVNLASQYANRK